MSRRLSVCATVCAALLVGVFLAAGATAAAPPAPSFTSTPSNPSNDRSPTFRFTAGTADTFRCELRKGSVGVNGPVRCGGPVTGSKSYSNLGDGSYTFRVQAFNADGSSGVSPFHWRVDATPPPTPTITAMPSNPSNDASPTFRFSDSEGGVTFQCRLDTASFAGCTSPKTYTGRTDGNHTFRVRALDVLHNTSSAASYGWTLDRNAPPPPTIESGPANPTTSSSATFVFSDSRRKVTFQCRLASNLDLGEYAGCTSPKTYSGLAPGDYMLLVRATDQAGNIGDPASYAWTVVPPPDTTAPSDVSRLRRSVGYKTLQIAWSRPPDADFDHVQVLIATARKGAKSVPRKIVYTGKSTHYTNTRFKSGQYYRFRILSYDHAGNRSPGVDVVVSPSILLRSPRDGSVVRGPLGLRWAAVLKATFYNVQLYRGGSKILSAWPRAARLRVKRHWSYSGHHFRLKKGQYQWFVWPGFGPRAKGRYGRLLGQATFTVG